MEEQKNGAKRRDSRAAQAAQRRKTQRKEDARLEELRKKQRRRARHLTRRRISPSTLRALLIMAGVLVAVVLSMLIFFRVGEESEHILISGNQYYTDEEILAACGVSEGDNLLLLSRGKISGNLLAALPYVKDVQITRKLPNTLLISLNEYSVSYAVRDETGQYYLMTAGGKITRAISQSEAGEYILVDGLRICTPVVGAQAEASVEEDTDAAQRMSALTQLLSEIESAELSRQISAVRADTAYSLEMDYGTQYLVRLGSTERLAYKLEYLKKVVDQLESYRSGTIDLSFEEGDQARFTPKS